jgi:2-hydroxychromene-2-carboxylate isomerase
VDRLQPVFYYDLGSPRCYVAAEMIMAALPVVPEWEPVLGSHIGTSDTARPNPAPTDRTPTDRATTDRATAERTPSERTPTDRATTERVQIERVQIERDAAELGLQQIRWPANWPPDTHDAMLAATYAKQIGRAVAFSLAAFRQAFAGGRDLSDENTILIAGAACEMHPTALKKGIVMRSTRDALRQATDRARAAGARELPAIQVGDRVYTGANAIADATAALEPGVPRAQGAPQ